jgi:hypothetical protein
MVPPTTVGITVTAATQGRVMGIGLISTAPTPAAGEVPVTIWGIAVGNCNGRRCPKLRLCPLASVRCQNHVSRDRAHGLGGCPYAF